MVAGITTLHLVVPLNLLLEATRSAFQLEWPGEVVGLLEVWAKFHDLMGNVLNADGIVLPKALMSKK